MATGLAVAQALGVEADAALMLLREFTVGMANGLAKKGGSG